MPTLNCLHCGKDTGIKRDHEHREALCPTCEEEVANWTVDLVEREFRCDHEAIGQTPSGMKYCADCGLIFQ